LRTWSSVTSAIGAVTLRGGRRAYALFGFKSLPRRFVGVRLQTDSTAAVAVMLGVPDVQRLQRCVTVGCAWQILSALPSC